MIMVNIFEAKAKLSEYLDAAVKGERVVICNRNRPIAELRPIAAAPAEPRPIGGAKGFVVSDSFFDPLPDDVLDSFSGEDTTDWLRALKVSEKREPYGRSPGKRRK